MQTPTTTAVTSRGHRLTQLFSAVLVSFLLASGCATTSRMMTPSPVGDWVFEIPNTRQGDASGTLTITSSQGGLAGQMYLDMFDSTFALQNVQFLDDVLSFSASVDTGSHTVEINARLSLTDNDSMTGALSVGGGADLEMSATRSE